MLVRTPSLNLVFFNHYEIHSFSVQILLSHLALSLIPLVEARVKACEFATICYTCYDWGLGLSGPSTYRLWLRYKVCHNVLVMDTHISQQ